MFLSLFIFCATVLRMAHENQVGEKIIFMIKFAKLQGFSFLKVIFINRNRCVIS